MLKVFQRRDVFRYDPARGRFRDWLGAVVRNQVAEYRRRPQERARPAGGDEQPPEAASPEAGPDVLWEEAFEKSLLLAALDVVRREVHPREYVAFEMIALREVSPAGAAAATGLSRNAVYKARRKVLARLRDLIGTYRDGGRLPELVREALAMRPAPAEERSLSARISTVNGGSR